MVFVRGDRLALYDGRASHWLSDQKRALSARGPLKVPAAVRLLQRFAFFRRISARLIGVGVRPEHVHTPDAFS